MGKKWKSPLRGHIIGNTIFLQDADWSNISDYEYIEFHASAKTRIAQVGNNGEVIFEDCFVYRQITCGDALCIMNNSTPDEIAKRVLSILHNYWKQLIDADMLPPQDTCAFPTNVQNLQNLRQRDVGEWRQLAVSNQSPAPVLQGQGRDAVTDFKVTFKK